MTTTLSPVKEEPCIFPWIDPYNEKIHHRCANPNFDPKGPWCPTKLYNGSFPKSTLLFGYCNEKCAVEEQVIGNYSNFLNEMITFANLNYSHRLFQNKGQCHKHIYHSNKS